MNYRFLFVISSFKYSFIEFDEIFDSQRTLNNYNIFNNFKITHLENNEKGEKKFMWKKKGRKEKGEREKKRNTLIM